MKTLFTAVSLAALMAMPAIAQETTAPSTGKAPAAIAAPPNAAPSAKGEKITSGDSPHRNFWTKTL